MIKIYSTLFLVFIYSLHLSAQQKSDSLKTDSLHKLKEVMVRGYLSDQPILNVPASNIAKWRAEIQALRQLRLVKFPRLRKSAE